MIVTVPPTSGHAFRGPRVLVVDDDPVVLRALRRLLLGAEPGWEIDVASSGDAALSLLASRAYDVVVTDLQMPRLDGVALLARLKAEQSALIRVIHSSHVESLAPGLADELAHAVLAKPVKPDELVSVLAWAVEQRRRQLRDSVGY
jgi:two-component system, NtrC family, response regulator HydG